MLAIEAVSSLANELHISPGTLPRWKKQALIDHNHVPGVKSFEGRIGESPSLQQGS